ncbi:histidine phosphatase family protein [Leptospira alstonii]|uniref:histidine phosphatase family protein n=1 Tax=Leptospira alstonii TaxID=28452 RepID=UPI00031E911C|nr:histidine phosphatase family protein [Leptospira alstonii]
MKDIFKKSNAIYVFRHGETEWNKEGRLQGHLEIPLTEKGERQSESIIPILKSKGVEILLSSDLKRAKRTSEIVSATLGLNPIFDFGFREAFLGEGQGKLISEVDFYFGQSFWERWNNPDPIYDTLRFPNGESKQNVDDRIHSSLMVRISLFSDRVIALCTHGFVMMRMLKTYKPKTKQIQNIRNVEFIEFNFEEILTREKSLK